MLALLHTNLLGCMLTCRAALRDMLHMQEAAIVNIGTHLMSAMSCLCWPLGGRREQDFTVLEHFKPSNSNVHQDLFCLFTSA